MECWGLDQVFVHVRQLLCQLSSAPLGFEIFIKDLGRIFAQTHLRDKTPSLNVLYEPCTPYLLLKDNAEVGVQG